MIQFNFTLTDEEAELLLGLVQDYLRDTHGRKHDPATSGPVRDWMIKHEKFIEGMKKKILDGQNRIGS